MLLRQRGLGYALIAYFLDITGVISAVIIARQLYVIYTTALGISTSGSMAIEVPLLFLGFSLVAWSNIASTFNLYDPTINHKMLREFRVAIQSVLLSLLMLSGTFYLLRLNVSYGLLIIFAIQQVIFLVGWRMGMRVLCRMTNMQRYPERGVLIVGTGDLGNQAAAVVQKYAWAGLRFQGFIIDGDDPPLDDDMLIAGTLDNLYEIAKANATEEVFIALPDHSYNKLRNVVLDLLHLPVNIRVVPDYLTLSLYRTTADSVGSRLPAADAEDLDGLLLINLRGPVLTAQQYLIKRLFDIAGSGLLILLASPIMLVTAIAIRLESKGPIIFKQERVGENGRVFTFYKFRSMVADAEARQDEVNRLDEDGHVIHKIEDDPRVTRVGKIIRKYSIDELPQFFNVLFGDMSLVGPRPEMPWLVDKYDTWQYKRFAVPQGLSGWWQVNGRSSKVMHLHTAYDLYYVENYSFWLDLFILLKTPLAVFRRTGAY
ncbi:MAG: sugar transferase [Anaerolineae bacterium]|nr:sugar transferase [Anaerolineae bacterium]